jgi:hypothetical protein
MKKNLCGVFAVLFGFSILVAGTYSGGSGTEVNPYLISDKDDLLELCSTNGDWDMYFSQTADITFSEADFQSGGDFYNSGSGFSPIGNPSVDHFSGTYDGNNHVVDGLIINRSSEDYIGFFGRTSFAKINNLNLINIDFSGKSCVGGLCGNSDYSIMEYCSSSGEISGEGFYLGGLVGMTSKDSINYCFSNVNISSSLVRVGGLVGDNNCNINNCYSRGDIIIPNCVYTGGLIGRNYSGITNCYSTGKIVASSNGGGLIGKNGSTADNSFWDTETSEMSSSDGGTGKTSVEMKTLSTFINAGWDFSGETANGSDDIWSISPEINDGYPYLVDNQPPELPTPVILTSFRAESIDEMVELTWITESEVENLGFIIEKRMSGESDWIKISCFNEDLVLRGAGTTTETHSYCFEDHDIKIGTSYEYRLSDVDYDGNIYHRGFLTVMTECGLCKACPNPFNPSTTLHYALPEAFQTSLKVYDINGRIVETLVDDYQLKGSYEISWQPEDLGTGVYFIHLRSGDLCDVKKIVYLK